MTKSRFRKIVWTHYKEKGRHKLPWRTNTAPYRILVSEIMLQQTQVERVETKFKAFIDTFPSITSLAQAPLGDVLRSWQGLGYNRRAKMLHGAARQVREHLSGRIPKTYSDLISLPGVGDYTAKAVLAFAHNLPVVMIETNIRCVYLHHFFPNDTKVAESSLLAMVEKTYDRENSREWYWALMDYGAMLKKLHGNQSRRAKMYTRQSPFEGSRRQLRGHIIRVLGADRYTLHELEGKIQNRQRVEIVSVLEDLVKEGLIVKKRNHYTLSD